MVETYKILTDTEKHSTPFFAYLQEAAPQAPRPTHMLLYYSYQARASLF